MSCRTSAMSAMRIASAISGAAMPQTIPING